MDNGIQQYITGIAGFLGLVIASVIVRLGWTKKAEEQQSQPSQVVGQIISNKDLRELIDGIDEHKRSVDELTSNIADLTREARNVGDEVRRNTNKGN